MTTVQYADKLPLRVLNHGEVREITGCYIGDLLSWVMGRASAGQVWLTVMTNLNVAAVASMTDVSAVVLCEGVIADDDFLMKAKQLGLPLFATEKSAYEIACCTYECLR